MYIKHCMNMIRLYRDTIINPMLRTTCSFVSKHNPVFGFVGSLVSTKIETKFPRPFLPYSIPYGFPRSAAIATESGSYNLELFLYYIISVVIYIYVYIEMSAMLCCCVHLYIFYM